MKEQNIGMKERLQELVSNVQRCGTESGLKELESLYTSKRKEHKDAVSPMMDIMVRDAIDCRRATFADEKAAAKQVNKKINEMRYSQFKQLAIEIDEGCSTAVYSYNVMCPVTNSDVVYTEQVQSIIERTESAPMTFVSDVVSQVNPLTTEQRIQIYESAGGTLDLLESAGSHFKNIEHMKSRGISHIYACATPSQRDEMYEVGQYFLKTGGESFTIIELNDYISESKQCSYSSIRDIVIDDKYDEYKSIVGLNEQSAELQFKMLGEIL